MSASEAVDDYRRSASLLGDLADFDDLPALQRGAQALDVRLAQLDDLALADGADLALADEALELLLLEAQLAQGFVEAVELLLGHGILL